MSTNQKRIVGFALKSRYDASTDIQASFKDFETAA